MARWWTFWRAMRVRSFAFKCDQLMVAFNVFNVGSKPDIWKEDDLSTGEKRVDMNERLLVFFEVRRVGNRKENWFGHVLYASGKQLSFELDQIGRDWDEWGHIENPKLEQTGVMLWEGCCRNANITHPEWEPDFVGTWRKPTAAELEQMLVPVDTESTG